jgi:hypothetical protein
VYFGPKPKTFVEWLVIVGVLLVLIALLIPAEQASHESSRRALCQNNLKQLAIAILNYDARQDVLPPAYVADSQGTPLVSWRALILPQLERADLYEKLDCKQPWDAPINRIASSVDVDLFHCPNDPTQTPTTNYFAIVGPNTAWPGGRGRKISEITDGTSQTILLMEAAEKGIPWAQPKDLSFDEAVELLSSKHGAAHLRFGRGGYFEKGFEGATTGIHIVMANGQIWYIASPIPKDLAIALLTVDGGEPIDMAAFERLTAPRLDYARCYAFGTFVLLIVLPGLRKLWQRRSEQGST